MNALARTLRTSLGRALRAGWVSFACMLVVAALAYGWADRLYVSLDAYRSPLQETLPAGAPLIPLSDGVVLVILDGLRYDAAMRMPALNALAAQGADAVVVGEAPTYSETTWTTLVTGATAQLSGAPVFNETYGTMRSVETDHLFVAASDAGRATAIAGSHWWEKMIPAGYRGAGAFTAGSDGEADRELVAAAASWLERPQPPQFTLVHLSQTDWIGETYGTTGPAYAQAALNADELVRAIADRLDFSRQTLLVVADHGQIDKGGHGGTEPASSRTRLVAAGKGIRGESRATLRQADIAPTVAALLGCRAPAGAEGQFADALLDWGGEVQARGWAELAKSRAALAAAYLRGIGAPPAANDVEMSHAALLDGWLRAARWDEAHEDAVAVVRGLNERMADARQARLRRERWGRLWLPAGYLLVTGLLLWRSRRVLPLGPALLAVAVYHALFLMGRNPYSFSMISSESQFLLGVAGRTLAGLLLGWLWWKGWGEWRRTLAYGWLTIGLVGLPIIGVAWYQGPLVTWTLPHFDGIFILLMSLIQVLMTIGGALLLAVIAWTVCAARKRSAIRVAWKVR